jgi:hypothetical protein
MLKSNKRQPALTDLDPMPFGKFKGVPMQDVPPSYLQWLKNEGCSNVLVANYIYNSWEAIQQELGET